MNTVYVQVSHVVFMDIIGPQKALVTYANWKLFLCCFMHTNYPIAVCTDHPILLVLTLKQWIRVCNTTIILR